MKKRNFRAAWHKAAAVRTSRYGLWSAGITALAVAVAITVNLLVGQLPETWTQFDMSGSGIYDITDTSRTTWRISQRTWRSTSWPARRAWIPASPAFSPSTRISATT